MDLRDHLRSLAEGGRDGGLSPLGHNAYTMRLCIESMSANRKGDRLERELVNKLDEAGCAVMRAPASGSATDRELPDVVAGNGQQFYAIEAKSRSSDTIYIDEREIDNLTYFAENFGAEPLIGVRFDRAAWYFFDPADVYRTGGGNYRVKRETAVETGRELAGLVGESQSTETGHTEAKGQVPATGQQAVLTAVKDGDISVSQALEKL